MPPRPAKQQPRPPARGAPRVGNLPHFTADEQSVLNRIRPVRAENYSAGIKIMLYGVSGSGKTTLWSTFPGPILAILASGGLQPGELLSVATPENEDRISEVPLHQTSEMRELLEFLHSGDGQRFQTVVLDHVTGYQDLVLKEILGLETIPVQKNWGMARQDQYGQCVAQCKEAFRGLLNLPVNVVFVGQQRTFGSGGDGPSSDLIAPTVGVGVMPGLAQWLNPAVDYIGQTCIRAKMQETTTTIGGQPIKMMERVKGEVEYCLRTGPDDVYTTKFRRPRGLDPLPEFIVDPTYDKIIELIRGA